MPQIFKLFVSLLKFLGKKAGSSHNLTTSDSKSIQENKECMKKEHEAEHVRQNRQWLLMRSCFMWNKCSINK